MTDVFVSYKREDKPTARTLVQSLRQAGFVAWWDEDIPVGAPWEATIAENLDRAAAVAVVWTRNSVASENVLSEARQAKKSGKLLQVIADDVAPPLFFGEHQAIDIRGVTLSPSDGSFRALCDAVAAMKKGEKPPRLVARTRARRRKWIAASATALVAASTALAVYRQGIGAYIYQALPPRAGERLAYLTETYLDFRPSEYRTRRPHIKLDFPSDPSLHDVLGRQVLSYTKDSSVKVFTIYTRLGGCAMHLVHLSQKFRNVISPFLRSRFSIVILDISMEIDRDRTALVKLANDLGPDFFVVAPDLEQTREIARRGQFYFKRVDDGDGGNVSYDLSGRLLFFDKDAEFFTLVSHMAEFKSASIHVLKGIMDVQPLEISEYARGQLNALASVGDVTRISGNLQERILTAWLQDQARIARIDLDENARNC